MTSIFQIHFQHYVYFLGNKPMTIVFSSLLYYLSFRNTQLCLQEKIEFWQEKGDDVMMPSV